MPKQIYQATLDHEYRRAHHVADGPQEIAHSNPTKINTIQNFVGSILHNPYAFGQKQIQSFSSHNGFKIVARTKQNLASQHKRFELHNRERSPKFCTKIQNLYTPIVFQSPYKYRSRHLVIQKACKIPTARGSRETLEDENCFGVFTSESLIHIFSNKCVCVCVCVFVCVYCQFLSNRFQILV